MRHLTEINEALDKAATANAKRGKAASGVRNAYEATDAQGAIRRASELVEGKRPYRDRRALAFDLLEEAAKTASRETRRHLGDAMKHLRASLDG